VIPETVSKGITIKPWLKSIEGEAPMFTDLNVFQTAHALAVHAGQRQAIVAQNVANADTPGYRARDIAPFAKMVSNDGASGGMRASRTGHLNGAPKDELIWGITTPTGAMDPNGNSVSVEKEMLKGVEIKRQHDLALAIYKSSLNILRTSLGRA
jgi:flagellar basal-body rod protein FlgB